MRAMWAFVATALVLGSCAQKDWIDRTLVTENVTGVWAGSFTGGPSRFQFELQQQGAKVTGTINMSTTLADALRVLQDPDPPRPRCGGRLKGDIYLHALVN